MQNNKGKVPNHQRPTLSISPDRRRKYQKCTTSVAGYEKQLSSINMNMNMNINPPTHINSMFNQQPPFYNNNNNTFNMDMDEITTQSSETSSTGSIHLSNSTCTSNNIYEMDFYDNHSISTLNSQLLSNGSNITSMEMGNYQVHPSNNYSITENTDINDDNDNDNNNNNNEENNFNTHNTTITEEQKLPKRTYCHRYHHFKNKLENNIEFVLKRDNNRINYELSKEATFNHNTAFHYYLNNSVDDNNDTDYDADNDDDDDYDLQELRDYEEMELEECFQDLNI